MRIAIDFDDTIVEQDGRPYEDVTTPLQMKAGALEGLQSLKLAGHQLLLWSARASYHLRVDPHVDAWVRAGVRAVSKNWKANVVVNEARYQQMLDFVESELFGIFDAIDEGTSGKPSVDLFIDDKALRIGNGPTAMDWRMIARVYGEPVYGSAPQARSHHADVREQTAKADGGRRSDRQGRHERNKQ